MALKYLKVRDQIKMDILLGKYPINSFLPTEPELMELYGVSRTTLRRAVALLAEDGVLEACQGRGTQVRPFARFGGSPKAVSSHTISNVHGQFTTGEERDCSSTAAAIDRIPAGPEVAEALGIPVVSEVYRLQRLRYIREEPLAYITDYIREDFIPDMEQYSGQIYDLNAFLYENFHVTTKSVKGIVSAKKADFAASQFLKIPLGAPVLVFLRTSTYDGAPLKYSVSVFNGELYQLVLDTDDDVSVISADGEE